MLIEHHQQQCNKEKNKSPKSEFKQLGLNRIG